MAQNIYDLIVIGSGPGGYVAAIKAAQLGMNVACVEKSAIGGTCLNVGCIPSKALLSSSHRYHEACNNFQEHGIDIKSVELNLDQMMNRKKSIVESLSKGISGLFKKNKVTHIHGTAAFVNRDTIQITDNEQNIELVKSQYFIIATGSVSSSLPNIDIDEINILSSTGALSLNRVPKSLIVIGGGYIGLEMGSIWKSLGADVTIVEYMDSIMANEDMDVSKEMQKILEKQGLKFQLSSAVLSCDKKGDSIELTIQSRKDNQINCLRAEKILVAAGRRPYTEALNLDQLPILLDEKGFIKVDDTLRTNIDNIYAIGDVIGGKMLAHKAEEEAIYVVERLNSVAGHINYETIAGVLYTHPEMASVGISEKALKMQSIDYKVSKFPFIANARAKANGASDGFVKMITDSKTDRILGCTIIGEHAGELISEIVLAMEYRASSEDIARICHPHPSCSEAVKEAALGSYFKFLHI